MESLSCYIVHVYIFNMYMPNMFRFEHLNFSHLSKYLCVLMIWSVCYSEYCFKGDFFFSHHNNVLVHKARDLPSYTKHCFILLWSRQNIEFNIITHKMFLFIKNSSSRLHMYLYKDSLIAISIWSPWNRTMPL